MDKGSLWTEVLPQQVTAFLIWKHQKVPSAGRTQLRREQNCFWASEEFQQQPRGSSANGEPPEAS